MATPPATAATADPILGPVNTYSIYHRVQRRKFPILTGTPSSSSPTTTTSDSPLATTSPSPVLYILGPPPWALRTTKRGNKSPYIGHSEWISSLHLGGNPKYSSYPSSKVLGVSTRGRWFSTFSLQIGGDAPLVLERKRKEVAVKKLKTMNRWRKVFCMGPKELEWEDAEGMEEDMGTVVNGEMKHVKHRRYEVAVRFGEREERMVVTGTRKYSKAKKTGTKGFALSLKMVRESDHALIADLERTSKGGIKGNKELGEQLGIVRIYQNIVDNPFSNGKTITTTTQPAEGVPQESLSMDAMVVYILWSMLQAEHLKRNKIMEILEEIAQEADGG